MNTGTSSNPDSKRIKKFRSDSKSMCTNNNESYNISYYVLALHYSLIREFKDYSNFYVILLTVKLYYFPGFIYAALHNFMLIKCSILLIIFLYCYFILTGKSQIEGFTAPSSNVCTNFLDISNCHDCICYI